MGEEIFIRYSPLLAFLPSTIFVRSASSGAGIHHDHARPVARMERSEIRERRFGSNAAPDFTSFHPGYKQQTNKKGSGTPKDAEHHPPHLAVRRCPHPYPPRVRGGNGRGQHAFRRSTTALARGTRASLRLSSGQASRDTAPLSGGLPPPAPAPVTAMHLARRS